MSDDLGVVAPRDAAQWEAWLEDHGEKQSGIWLRIAKKGSGVASVTMTEAVEIALCFGWIDSLRHSLDETHYLQKFTPRRPGSSWSAINVGRVAQLAAAGRMRDRGLAEVAAARADGRWDAATR